MELEEQRYRDTTTLIIHLFIGSRQAEEEYERMLREEEEEMTHRRYEPRVRKYHLMYI